MTYTMLGDVDANAIQVNFIEDTLEIEQLNAKRYRMRVQIEETR
jgi:hypothetical protein